MTGHVPVGEDAGPDEVGGDWSLAPRLISARLRETNVGGARPVGLEIAGVALGIALAVASLVRRALNRSAPAWSAADGARRPAPLTALLPGAFGGLGVGAVRLGSVLTSHIAAPLRSVAGPLVPLARPLEPALRDVLTALEASWRETRIAAEASAIAFARPLERELVRAVLDPLDLTEIVRSRVDIDELVDEIDVDRITARVDVEALVARLDLAALAQEVLDEIDLPALIRESTSTLTADAVEEVRYVSLDADRMVARVVDRLMRRSRRNLDAPGEPSSLTQPWDYPESRME